MDSLLILIPVALFMGLLGLAAFMWSLKSGQFDDLEGEASRILFDDMPPPPSRLPSRTPDSNDQTSPASADGGQTT